MPNRPVAWVQVLQFITESDEAVCCELTDGREIWIPFSAIDQTVRKPDDSGKVLVAMWLVKKEDMPIAVPGSC